MAEATPPLHVAQDLDGTSLAMPREEKLAVLDDIVHWANELLLIDARLRRPAGDRSPTDFGKHAWLQVFDDDDLATFVGELGEALLAAARQGSSADLDKLVDDWRVTAEALSDDDRRDVLLGHPEDSDFVEVARPS